MTKEMKKKSVLVIFSGSLPKKNEKWWRQFDTIVAPKQLEKLIHKDITFVIIDNLIEISNNYEASAFAEELSRLALPDGSRISKSLMYKGYELWWIYYHNLFLYFCLPYTQYKKLLEYIRSFRSVYLYQPPYKSLFTYYLQAYGCEFNIIRKKSIKFFHFLPFGILLQIIVTFISLPLLIVKKHRIMVFIGDKLDKSKDYDFRMKFIYQELRQKNLSFVEFIRSMESWRKVLRHMFIRKRPVIYSEGVIFIGRLVSFITGGHRRAKQKFGHSTFVLETDPEKRFKLLIATQHLLSAYDDIWAIRIMKWILRAIGVRATLVTLASERNFHAVLGCKLNTIPVIGILHGAASCHYNVHDFLPGFDGTKMLSADKYGLWSQWWKEYYLKNGKAYRKEQLFVSGPMRPIEISSRKVIEKKEVNTKPIRILFISEQLAVPSEVIPYLEALLRLPCTDFLLTFRFRPYIDGFREWLTKHRPDILERDDIKISEGELQDAIRNSDVVVGSHSTAVLEALFQYKVPILFKTRKWGDNFELRDYSKDSPFFAEDSDELVEKIKKAHTVSNDDINKLRERFFGDPYKNGSKWIVEEIEKLI